MDSIGGATFASIVLSRGAHPAGCQANARATTAASPPSSDANRSPVTGLKHGFSAGSWLSRSTRPVTLTPSDHFRRLVAGLGIGAGGSIVIVRATFRNPQLGPGQSAVAAPWPFRRGRARSKRSTKEQKNILVLMSNTGGGHKASAEALQAGFKQEYGDKCALFYPVTIGHKNLDCVHVGFKHAYGNKYKFDIVDAWKNHTPQPFRSIPDTYTFLVKHPILWRMAYMSQQPRIVHKPYLWGCGTLLQSNLDDMFDEYNPDLVISVHPLMQHVPLRVLRRRIREQRSDPINFATVVTDFTTCSNLWFSKRVTKCFVPTAFCANRARMMGLKDPQIVQHGLPIRPAFSGKRANAGKKASLRRKLGLDASLPAVLMVGGGEGMGQLEATVEEVLKQETACQVVVICGRNEKLKARLSGKQQGDTQVHAFGFVSNMHEFMGASDAIITKAGPGTIAEALISGLPILINGNVPCQEEGNIPYVVDNGCGTFERDPPKIAAIINRWFAPENRELLQRMAKNARALGRPDALFKIVKDLAQLAEHDVIERKQAKGATQPQLAVA